MPEGMQRVGYDADLGKYYFKDRDGTLWEGAEGVEFGEMKRGACFGQLEREYPLTGREMTSYLQWVARLLWLSTDMIPTTTSKLLGAV